MKKLAYLTLLLLPLLFSCNQKEVERLQQENDSLRNIVQQSDYTVQQYLAAFNEIQENLNKIKQKENIITVQTSGVEGELSDDVKDQINDDILTIYQLMEQNKIKLDEMKKQLKRSKYKNKELLKTIQLYEEQLQAKDKEINTLKNKLAELNINIEQLNQEIADLKTNIDTMKELTQEQQQKIKEQEEMIYTAYYIIGTKKELIEKGALTREGLLAKLEISGDFNKDNFTKIDTREVTEIPIMAKKVEIMSKHPSSSYQLVEDNGIINAIKITDPAAFWETSKFLVIMTK